MDPPSTPSADEDEIDDAALARCYAQLATQDPPAVQSSAAGNTANVGAGAASAVAPHADAPRCALQEAMRTLQTARNGNDAESLATRDEEGRWAQQELTFAVQELDVALRGNDVAKLASALTRAEKAGVASASPEGAQKVQAARVRKERLETDKQRLTARQIERKDAERALEEARLGDDAQVIDVAIEKAQALGVSIAAIAAAKKRKVFLEKGKHDAKKVTADTLERAVRGKDVRVLVSAIDWARKSGVDDEAIVRARQRVTELRAESRRERACEEERGALERAIKGTSIKALIEAIESASKSGVTAGQLAVARKRKLVLEQQERKRQKTAQMEAAEALELMTIGSDLDALIACEKWAQDTCVSETLLEPARKRIAALQEEAKKECTVYEAAPELEDEIDSLDVKALEAEVRKQAYDDAERGLKNAMNVKDIDVLSRAIEIATQAGVSELEINVVRKRKHVLESERRLEVASETARLQAEQVINRLERAVTGSDLEELTSALTAARRAGGVSAGLLSTAASRQKVLETEREARRLEEKEASALKAAIEAENIPALSVAIERAVAASVNALLLKEALAKKKKLQEAAHREQEKARKEQEAARKEQVSNVAANVLRSAVAAAGVGGLSSAINWATEAGVSSDVVENAKKQKDTLEQSKRRKALFDATKDVLELLERDNLPALSSAIDRAVSAGAAKSLIERARAKKFQLESQKHTSRKSAEAALRVALEEGSLAELRDTMAEAEKEGVDGGLMLKANERIAVLEDENAKMLAESGGSSSSRKLPPVPVFEGPHSDSKAVDDHSMMQDEAGGASSSGSSSGSEDEEDEEEEEEEEEDDDEARDMEVDAEDDIEDEQQVNKNDPRAKLFKLGEFCCEVFIGFVSGCRDNQQLLESFNIDLRAKVERCRAHLDQAGSQVTVWHFTLATKKGREKYQALCDYFVGKSRVGLVDTPSYYMYVVPPGEMFLPEFGLPKSETIVGLQVPKDKTDG